MKCVNCNLLINIIYLLGLGNEKSYKRIQSKKRRKCTSTEV